MRRDAGFTLLEILVAFIIAALALSVLFSGGLTGLTASRTAARTDEAAARAQSRLAALCHGARLQPGPQDGDDGSGFTWRTQVREAGNIAVEHGDPDDAHPPPPFRVRLFDVNVAVTWTDGPRQRTVALNTQCLASQLARGGS